MKNGDRSRRDAKTLRAASPIRRRARRERPRHCRAAEKRDELAAAAHSMSLVNSDQSFCGYVCHGRARCRTPVTAKPMIMRAQTNIQSAINSSLRGRLGSLMRGQTLAEALRDRHCTQLYASQPSPLLALQQLCRGAVALGYTSARHRIAARTLRSSD
jgi:hypothetical protein